VAEATTYGRQGVFEATPKGQNPFPPPPLFFFLAFWGGRTTPKGLGWLRPPPYGRYGVAESTPWPKMGWSGPRGGFGHPTFGKGVAPATAIPFFFFSKKKKKKKNLKCKTTPFCPKLRRFAPKRRRFGRAQTE
jgi:hypothetical protein